MSEINETKKTETGVKRQKWVKRWEPHKHCSVCGLAVDPTMEFCSSKCSGEYQEWKKDQDKKNKRNTYMTFVLMAAMIVIMVVMTMFAS